MSVLVADCSAYIDYFVSSELSKELSDLAIAELHAPSLVDFEFVSVIRRKAQRGEIGSAESALAIGHFMSLDIARHHANRLIPRVWSLREVIFAYDASYVALAEALEAPLLTSDLRLARAAEPYCEVIVTR